VSGRVCVILIWYDMSLCLRASESRDKKRNITTKTTLVWPRPTRSHKAVYDPPVSAINGHRFHPIPDTARRRHRHDRIRDLKISGYRSMPKEQTRKSTRGQSKKRLYCVSVPRDPLARPSIPDPCVCCAAPETRRPPSAEPHGQPDHSRKRKADLTRSHKAV
jgi:hypothetical protein